MLGAWEEARGAFRGGAVVGEQQGHPRRTPMVAGVAVVAEPCPEHGWLAVFETHWALGRGELEPPREPLLLYAIPGSAMAARLSAATSRDFDP